MSVQQNNHNTLHTNPNLNIVQDSKNSTYNTVLILTTKNCTNNENVPIKNSHKMMTRKLKITTPK